MRPNIKWTMLAWVLSGAAAVHAQDSSCLSIKTTVESIQHVAGVKGRKAARLLPADTINPGETVIYTVSAANICDKPLEHALIGIPVPGHMTYVAGSAVGPGTDIAFSADGGFQYATPEALLATSPDGKSITVPVKHYTHIRWIMRMPLKPGAVAFARFRAVFER